MAEPCPRCAAPVEGERCTQCGLVVALYHGALEKLRRGPTAPPPTAVVGVLPAPAASDAGDLAAGRSGGGDGGRLVSSPRLVFHGSAWTLLGIHVVNVLLVLLTLGIFYFWGKARVRAYLYSQSELAHDRFAYHGTGRELLVGFLKGLTVFGIPVVLLSVVPQVFRVPAAVAGTLQTLLWLVGVVLVPVAMVGARRYRLSRTSWRGIRFSFRGPVREFVGIFIVGSILTSLTLGVYYPVFVTRRQAFMVSHAYFGSRKFDFDARGRALIGPFLVMALLFVPTLGLSWFWFSARRHRFFTEHTRFGATRFRSAVGGGALAWLQISNLLAIVLTLGLAWPWTVVRSMRFYYRYVTLQGPLDLGDVRQDARAASATGEGLAGLLDADFGVS
jgi:uncharacterized membrane protein YjgN (DUF898 family)